MAKNNPKIKIIKNGPYLVSGKLPLGKEIIMPDGEGNPIVWKKGKSFPEQEEYALCRCGQSKNKPFCDGTHLKNKFNGKETARMDKYADQCQKISGPDLDLTDAEELCAAAGFCHRMGGTWNLTEKSDNPDFKKVAIEQACNCPSGRLVAWDKKTKKAIEPTFKQSISVTEDACQQVSGPLWVKGNVLVESADGKEYEIRNRVTLCRCGKSSNKPFCNGSHIPARFNDGDETIK